MSNSGVSSPPPVAFLTGAAGAWYGNPLGTGSDDNGGSFQNSLSLQAPYNSGPTGCTISKLNVVVNNTGVGSTVRLGVYEVINQTDPFTWVPGQAWATLLAATSVPTTAAGSIVATLSTPLVIPPNTWFCVGGVDQSTTNSVPSRQAWIGASQSGFGVLDPPIQVIPDGLVNTAITSLWMDAVSGALPTSFVPVHNANELYGYDAGVGFFRSA